MCKEWEEGSGGAVLRLVCKRAGVTGLSSAPLRAHPTRGPGQLHREATYVPKLAIPGTLPGREKYPSPPALHVQGKPSKIAGFQKKRPNVGFPNQTNLVLYL